MHLGVISLFPEMFSAVTDYGVTGRAVKNERLKVSLWNPRDFTDDKHRTVDDRPYGGGPGMVMKVAPLMAAIDDAKTLLGRDSKVIYLSPQGKPLTQAALSDMAKQDSLILLAGRYEGIDERLIQQQVDEEWSIGDYVLSGGELPAMVLIDGMARLIPGVLGDAESAVQDSFVDGLLDHPHYTRPEELNSEVVPPVLLGGDHEAIRKWRLKQSLGRTWLRRPDLLVAKTLDKEQAALLEEFIAERGQD
ncbi:tRNA (guanosine(37)-N1)-methyltransferase TrmD [Methylophaga sp. OBS3]|uniref:tRNA (guanosine(37)-N1)-methyltransferase TrmD n=1 Tax=Methylophaga sp. OBS3 TaxID=2991934 RepID=UPI0022558CAB|nr:tRNA (guanosine(37)-N1)-methyltransferase TrmD [Methylophaga sp. OBS3]MCX4190297.1 tRNA (guanosine(37)-N1)-methyltransferase TrmD [Methylophaga sp. OBS3]